ncbi:MAG TPA: flagellar assembly protein A [Gallionella sp.]|nr:flagellar assembly protein A [Gallionella sp.]
MTSSESNNAAANVSSEDMVFPSFIYNRVDGVFVDLPRLLAADGGLERFVERMFASGARFSGLDYDAFLKLLYDADWLVEMQSKATSLKLAESIVRFPPERQALYRKVKIGEGAKRAEYMFEPVHFDESYKEPVYGPAGADGIAPILSYETMIREVSTKLDFDELVADMWLKGVKFGLREEAIRKIIASGDTIRLPIAMHLDPTASRDAEIIEVCADLHRDNSPKLLANGKADLGVYKNRFPHVNKDTRLLKKVPRALGKPGYKVTGEIIEPEVPKDLDLHPFAAAGTVVEQNEEGEFIVAAMDGFIGIDAKSNSISITEKIETKDGISAKTTGDLALEVEEFIEHGEVQEGRTVKGKHMTFMADVFGNVISEGGNIYIAGNASGGRLEALDGNITLASRATREVVRAIAGEVTATQCESSLLVGRIVRVEYAVNCEIIADEVYADTVEGCIITGKLVKIKSSGERRGKETLVTMLIPDCSGVEQRIAAMQKQLGEMQAAIVGRLAGVETLKSDLEFAKFLGLHARIESGAIKLTNEQAVNWQKLVSKNAKAMQQMAALNKEIGTLEKLVKDLEEEVSYSEREQDEMGNGVACEIETVVGHTVGQTLRSSAGITAFNGMSGGAIRTSLQTMDAFKERIFIGDDGSIAWKFREAPVA